MLYGRRSSVLCSHENIFMRLRKIYKISVCVWPTAIAKIYFFSSDLKWRRPFLVNFTINYQVFGLLAAYCRPYNQIYQWIMWKKLIANTDWYLVAFLAATRECHIQLIGNHCRRRPPCRCCCICKKPLKSRQVFYNETIRGRATFGVTIYVKKTSIQVKTALLVLWCTTNTQKWTTKTKRRIFFFFIKAAGKHKIKKENIHYRWEMWKVYKNH